jgi:hypothetical protein
MFKARSRGEPGYGLLAVTLTAFLLLTGCAGIDVHTKPYLAVPTYSPTDPATVQVLAAEPNVPKERLGEIMLSVSGQPSRADIEKRLREAAAKLGANAVFLVYDRTHIFPIVYQDWYWGYAGVSQEVRRDIVGVAIRYKGR